MWSSLQGGKHVQHAKWVRTRHSQVTGLLVEYHIRNMRRLRLPQLELLNSSALPPGPARKWFPLQLQVHLVLNTRGDNRHWVSLVSDQSRYGRLVQGSQT